MLTSVKMPDTDCTNEQIKARLTREETDVQNIFLRYSNAEKLHQSKKQMDN